MPAQPITELLERRSTLLADPDGTTPDRSEELDRVTAELRRSLAGARPRVRRVTPDEPGDLLERLADAEPVHPIEGPDDLADRLAEDRRCFVLEHPLLPGRPMNVVWVALWKGIPTHLGAVLDPAAATADPAGCDTAAFYSIWNVEPGLVGLPGGKELLAGAIDELRAELPALDTFVTLSPIPGFRRWTEQQDQQQEGDGGTDVASCCRYLTTFGADGRLIDPVARFHMSNGARLLQVAPRADVSARGLDRSFGHMANYRYEPEDRVHNRELLDARRPAVGPQVEAALAGT